MAFDDDVLRALLKPARPALPAGWLGPGDDACVVPAASLGGGSLVLSCDALEEGVHFRGGWLGLADLAHKLLAVNLSDVAAMGAEPLGVLVAVSWPSSLGEADAADIGIALVEACSAWSCPLLGGDTDVREGSLRLEATIVARCDRPLLRSTARAGDALFVTGPLGGAALAVAAWESGKPLDPATPAEADALRRFRRPTPRLDASRAIRDAATACIDLSDGLAADAGKLAVASGLRARIRESRVPKHAALQARGSERLALHGGEDYELLVAGPATLASAWPGLTAIGVLEAGEPRVIIE